MLKDGNTPHSLAGSFTGSSDPLTRSAGGVGEGRWHPLIGLEHQPFSNWRGLWLASKLLIYYPNTFYCPHILHMISSLLICLTGSRHGI